MRAFVLDSPDHGAVQDVAIPQPRPDEVLIKVAVVGLCGTDVELHRGTMPYFRDGLARYPLRPGHEWAGTIEVVGSEVARFAVGDRVTGDTFIGCGTCELCRSGRHYLCLNHVEVGVRGGRDGALADYLAMPETALYRVPDSLTLEGAAFVEPGSCSLRGVKAADVVPGTSVLIWGAGTLGLLAAAFSRLRGGAVTVVTRRPEQSRYVQSLGFELATEEQHLGEERFDSVIDATGADDVPERALARTRPGGRLVLLGVPSGPVGLPVRHLVHEDLTVVGVLGGSTEIAETIEIFATGAIDLPALIADRVRLQDVEAQLRSGLRHPGVVAPKTQVRVSSD